MCERGWGAEGTEKVAGWVNDGHECERWGREGRSMNGL